jgi:adenine/guanine/hypoxanthine permease
MQEIRRSIRGFFERHEVGPGLTTFLTMSYIIVVNPSILAGEQTGMSFSGVMTATVLLAATMTFLMGFYAKLPFAVAPGMGINAFFAYTLILGQGIPWPKALGMVFWAGLIFLILSISPVRAKLAKAIPEHLRLGSAVGIGLFLTFIGLRNAGIVVSDPVTFVKMGEIGFEQIVVVGSLLLMVFLMMRGRSWAFLAGIAFSTCLFALNSRIELPAQLLSMPDFQSVMGQMDIFGALDFAYIPAIVAIFFTDMFDSIATFVGVSKATNLVDEEQQPLRLREGLIVDSLATMFAGVFGTSSGTTYIESAAGIEAGGRSGKTAMVVALLFVPCLFIAPLAAMVPSHATAPVLIIVGAMMFKSVLDMVSQRWEDLIPGFLTMILIPLTFSITQGMLWGFVAHVALYVLAGRRRDLSAIMFVIGVLSFVLLIFMP